MIKGIPVVVPRKVEILELLIVGVCVEKEVSEKLLGKLLNVEFVNKSVSISEVLYRTGAKDVLPSLIKVVKVIVFLVGDKGVNVAFKSW
jgi:hypothetical protein